MVPKPTLEKRGRRNREEEREVAPGKGEAVLFWQGARRDRGEGEGYLRCPRRGPKYPRLKLDTKTPVGVKPEICT